MKLAFLKLSGVCLALVLSANVVQAAEIKVLTVGALQVAMRNLAADFTKETGNDVTIATTNPANLTKDMAAGQFDIACAATVMVEDLEETGALLPMSRARLARTGVGVAIREGAPKPDISTVTAFRKAVMAAKNFIYTDPAVPNASGAVTQHILINAGLLDAMKTKGRLDGLASGRERIAKGEIEMGFFNVSESLAPGVVLAGPVPAPLQQHTDYDIAILKTAAAKKEAADFMRYVTAKAASTQWAAAGLQQAPVR